MAIDVVVPEVGEIGMEVTFVRWLKAEGDEVRAGEPLFELDTAKSIMEVEAIEDGHLADLRASEGDLVMPHQVLAVLLSEGETLPAPASAADTAAAETTPIAAPPPAVSAPPAATAARGADGGRVSATPKARRLARDLGVDLARIRGTGADGLVTEDDVRTASRDAPVLREVERLPEPAGFDVAPAGSDPREARIRRAVAELTTRSWRAIPHISLRVELDVTEVLARGRPSAVLAAGVVQALLRHPEYNLGWGADGRLYQRDSVDLGLLVDTEHGLLLPAVRQAERLDMAALESEIRSAAERARAGALRPDDGGSHSVTFSNLGMFAVDGFVGVIPAPDILLLSTGRIRTLPRWRNGQFEPRKLVEVTLSADHRALDGADGGRLLTILERILGDPEVLP